MEIETGRKKRNSDGQKTDSATDAFVPCNARLNLIVENAPIGTIKKMVRLGSAGVLFL